MVYQYDDINPNDYILSKSQVKRDMIALQNLGEKLVGMSDRQLAKIPLEENLLNAIHEARKMPQREARRRQLQYIGKLMRTADHEAIQAAVDRLQDISDQHIHRQHMIERYRDQLIAGDKQALQLLIGQYPAIDVQHLRHLIRAAQQELENDQPAAGARKLFRYIREQVALQDGEE